MTTTTTATTATTTTSEVPLLYTLGFIRCKDNNKILLLNRNKSPWMGLYNGVGGKYNQVKLL